MKKSLQLLVAGAAMSLSLLAHAEQTTVTSNTILDLENHPGALTFASFNSSLGTLTGMKIDLFSDLSGTIYLGNSDNVPVDMTVGVGGVLTVNIGSPLLHSFSTPSVVQRSYTVLPSDDLMIDSFANQHFQGTSAVYQDAATLAAVSSSIPVQTTLGDVYFATGSGNADYGALVQVDAHAVITYIYTPASVPVSPVPEAETYAMMLAGLGMIGFVRRKKNAA